MTTLDELFGQALQREATAPSAERLATVSDATVQGARRRRRIRVSAQAVALLVVAGVVVGVGSTVLGGGGATPSDTDSPAPGTSAPAPAPEPSAAPTSFGVEDARMPLETPMTPADWAAVDSSWDVELAAFANDGNAAGSTAEVFLTSPDEERRFAYGYHHFPLTAPILLAIDPSSGKAMVYDDDTKTVHSVDFATGTVDEIQNMLGERISTAAPLGRTSDGASVFLLETAPDSGELKQQVFVLAGDAAQGVQVLGTNPSPVWGNTIVTHATDGFVVTNIVSGNATTLAGFETCEFDSWTTDGTFLALCDASDDAVGHLVEVDPGTGAQTASDVTVLPTSDPIADLIRMNAIDGKRWWQGDGAYGRDLRPPAVYWGEELADLSAGYSATPDTYTVLFGARG